MLEAVLYEAPAIAVQGGYSTLFQEGPGRDFMNSRQTSVEEIQKRLFTSLCPAYGTHILPDKDVEWLLEQLEQADKRWGILKNVKCDFVVVRPARAAGKRRLGREAGSALFILAGGMVVLLGVSALAIDLASFYVARNEAQRAADAAALAGASMFVSQGCTSAAGGCVAGGQQERLARQQAVDVAAQNMVAGEAPTSSTVDVGFSYPSSEEPEITVTVHRNAMPTFFAKIFGMQSVDVSAAATAEAFNPTGSNLPIGTACLKPFLVPNCDPVHSSPANPVCDTGAGYFFDPNTRAIQNPGEYDPSNPTNSGVIGMPWTLHTNAAPSQWYLIAFGGSQSAALFRTYIEQCAPQVIACGDQLDTLNGNRVGPVAQGITTLIHAGGQDTICSPTTTPACKKRPFPITGGSSNRNPKLVGKTFVGPSDSIITTAVYDGKALTPGGSRVDVLGYMQLFVTGVNGGDVNAIILDISICGAGASGPPVVAQGGPIPIRLIRQ